MEAEKFLEEQDIFDFVPDGPAKFECKCLFCLLYNMASMMIFNELICHLVLLFDQQAFVDSS